MSFIKQVVLPFSLSFSVMAFLMPDRHFQQIAFQYYHLQAQWMAGESL
jgi:hypothetical protein